MCREVSRGDEATRGVELVELAWGVEVSSQCRGLVSRCRGQGSGWTSRGKEFASSVLGPGLCFRVKKGVVPCGSSTPTRGGGGGGTTPVRLRTARWPRSRCASPRGERCLSARCCSRRWQRWPACAGAGEAGARLADAHAAADKQAGVLRRGPQQHLEVRARARAPPLLNPRTHTPHQLAPSLS